LEREARGKLGVFSEFAVADARDHFWDLMGFSKSFAKRQTFFDFIFTVNRDEVARGRGQA
jgi:hypothetical protein